MCVQTTWPGSLIHRVEPATTWSSTKRVTNSDHSVTVVTLLMWALPSTLLTMALFRVFWNVDSCQGSWSCSFSPVCTLRVWFSVLGLFWSPTGFHLIPLLCIVYTTDLRLINDHNNIIIFLWDFGPSVCWCYSVIHWKTTWKHSTWKYWLMQKGCLFHSCITCF